MNDSLADAVICEELRVLWGRDYYMEKILHLDFKVSAFSFFQTNVEAAERLYSEALALVPSFEGKSAFDLYCGTGTISQIPRAQGQRGAGYRAGRRSRCGGETERGAQWSDKL